MNKSLVDLTMYKILTNSASQIVRFVQKKKYNAILSSSKMKKRIQGDFIFVYKIQIYKRATETFRRNKKYHQQS